jgi:hypothetical protein
VGAIERLVEKAVESRTSKFVETVRAGWNSYSFVFYIGGVSAILGSLFGVAGWLSIIITLAFFYYAGKFKMRYDETKARRAKQRRKSRNKESNA